jgi:hypothetical protein
MPEALETLSWWSDAVADLKRKKLRDIAREREVSVKELQAAIKRTGAMAEPAADAGAEAGHLSASERIALHAASLGKVSDGAFASLAGVSRKTVVLYRKAHGIAPFEAGPGVAAAKRSPGRPARVAKAATGRKAGRGTGVTARSAKVEPTADGARNQRQSKLDGFLDIVGVLPDKEVAVRAGVTAENVRMFRARRGIAAQWQVDGAPRRGRPARAKSSTAPSASVAPETAGAETPPAPRRRGRPPRVKPAEGAEPSATSEQNLVDRALAPLLDKVGTVSDAEIATAAGISRSAVSAYRKKHGIRAAGRGGRPRGSRNKPKPAPAAATATAPAATVAAPATVTEAPARRTRARDNGSAAPTTTSTGWAVTLRNGQGEQVWTVVATDAVDAAQKATVAAGGATVVGLRAVGPVLG